MIYKSLIRNSCSALGLSLLAAYPLQSTLAEGSGSLIFKSVNSQGTTEYSNSYSSNSQSPAALPKITKSPRVLGSTTPESSETLKNSIRSKIENGSQPLKLAKDAQEVFTCSQRGGVDCSAGAAPNSDGVYCFDGTLALAHSFREICTEASLKEELYVEFSSVPKRKPHDKVYRKLRAVDKRQPSRLSVEIRNMSGVEAKVEAVYLKLPFLSPRRTKMIGPATIPAYGLEIFSIDFNKLPKGSTPRHLAETKVQIKCSNCKQAN